MGRFLQFVWLFAAPIAMALENPETWPWAGAVGKSDTTAVHMDDSCFVGWANGYSDITYGSNVDEIWQTPAEALGQAEGVADDHIVCLGRGGEITLTFSRPITDGDGYDFAVFENALNDVFLELGWVEVSSDGEHFCRFPNFYAADDLVSPFGGHYARDIHGLASKYRHGYGTPFDLSELQEAFDLCSTEDPWFFSSDYAESLTTHFPFLDLNSITHVKIIDIVGDGSQNDASGLGIYDPYPTEGSAGIDLDAVGVINQIEVEGEEQTISFETIPHQRLAFVSVALDATAGSGLPVSYSVRSGPATNAGNVLYFTGTGTVEVVASQSGDDTYAAASSVLRSFVVAEEVQHIFIEPVSNQLKEGGSVQLYAYASSGLPVKMEVQSGPSDVLIDEVGHLLDLGSSSGAVTLHAYQTGDATHAPAEDIYAEFEIVEASAANAPVPFATWLESNAVPELVIVSTNDVYGRPSIVLQYDFDPTASAYSRIIKSAGLVSWTNAVPKILGQTRAGNSLAMKLQLTASASNANFRLEFEAQ
jgi:hypothetical protein